MRANIIFHSISGNLYLIAEAFKESLANNGIDARMYRIEDEDLHLLAAERNDVNEYYEEIFNLPVASNEKLLNADLIMIGIPSRFGMPTNEEKVFLDKTWPLYEKKSLEGKYYYPFATSLVSYEDAMTAVISVSTWARMMGLKTIDYPPYVHKDGVMMPNRPGEIINKVAEGLSSLVRKL